MDKETGLMIGSGLFLVAFLIAVVIIMRSPIPRYPSPSNLPNCVGK
jgi:hypothetical protein